VAGLDLSAVHRLKATKAQLVGERLQLFEKMQELVSTDGSRKAYRAALKDSTPPCIPYLGVYLTDLTFIHEGNADTCDKECDGEMVPLINWGKREAYAEVIESVRFYQTTNYNLSPCESLEGYLRSAIKDLLMDEKEQYERSLEIEPRGTVPKQASGKK